MSQFVKYFVLRTIKLINAIMLTIPFYLSLYFYYSPKSNGLLGNTEMISMTVIYLLFYILFGKIYLAFAISESSISNLIYSQIISAVIPDIFLYIVISFISKGFPNPIPVLIAVILQGILSSAWCLFAHNFYYRISPPEPTAIIYDGFQNIDKNIIKYQLDKKYKVEKIIKIDDCFENLSVLDGTKTVFLKNLNQEQQNIIFKYCINNDIRAYISPSIEQIIMNSAKTNYVFHAPLLYVEKYHQDIFYSIIKRVFDIVFSIIAFVAISPIFLIISAAIKISDKGPVFYKQERLTVYGKKFYIHKFRSMKPDAEKDGIARLSTGENDDRITPVGRIIRKLRLDEIPQLLDIISGNMSIVGPRPERPEIAEQYCRDLPEFKLRLQGKAGLTGLAQVYGKYNSTPLEKLQMDLIYLSTASILTDLRICFATVKILFMPDSTEGISEGQITASDIQSEEEFKNGEKS